MNTSPRIQDSKVCIKCNITKPFDEFKIDKRSGKHKNVCIECEKEYFRKYQEEHKEHKKEIWQEYYKKNKDKIIEYEKEYRASNKEKIAARDKAYRINNVEKIRANKSRYYEENKEYFHQKHKDYYEQNSDKLKEYQRAYRENNVDKIFERRKAYRERNADIIKERKKEYGKQNRSKITSYYLNKRQTDPLFKLSTQVRGLIRMSLISHGYSKDTHTYEILGCDYETLWEHLKQSWKDNYGIEWNGEDYHIDHIIPLATAKTEQEVKELCHYKNLQLLKPEDNLAKNKKLDWSLPNKDN